MTEAIRWSKLKYPEIFFPFCIIRTNSNADPHNQKNEQNPDHRDQDNRSSAVRQKSLPADRN